MFFARGWEQEVAEEITKATDGEILALLLAKFGWWEASLGDVTHAEADAWCNEFCKSGWKNCYTSVMFCDRAEAALFKVFVT